MATPAGFISSTEQLDGGTPVVSVTGEVDLATVGGLERTLESRRRGPRRRPDRRPDALQLLRRRWTQGPRGHQGAPGSCQPGVGARDVHAGRPSDIRDHRSGQALHDLSLAGRGHGRRGGRSCLAGGTESPRRRCARAWPTSPPRGPRRAPRPAGWAHSAASAATGTAACAILLTLSEYEEVRAVRHPLRRCPQPREPRARGADRGARALHRRRDGVRGGGEARPSGPGAGARSEGSRVLGPPAPRACATCAAAGGRRPGSRACRPRASSC